MYSLRLVLFKKEVVAWKPQKKNVDFFSNVLQSLTLKNLLWLWNWLYISKPSSNLTRYKLSFSFMFFILYLFTICMHMFEFITAKAAKQIISARIHGLRQYINIGSFMFLAIRLHLVNLYIFFILSMWRIYLGNLRKNCLTNLEFSKDSSNKTERKKEFLIDYILHSIYTASWSPSAN